MTETEERELHHFEVEQENARLTSALLDPPAGWYLFGAHVGQDVDLEFWGEQYSEDGMPMWERPIPVYRCDFDCDACDYDGD